jgi:hypothetical protein
MEAIFFSETTVIICQIICENMYDGSIFHIFSSQKCTVFGNYSEPVELIP